MTERTVVKQTRLDDDTISLTSTVSETYASDDEFKVDRILAEKTQGGKKIYLISWDGYPPEKSTWEPQKNIQDDEILDVWKERKLRESKGLDEPFNMSEFNALLTRLAEEKAQRHKRRKAKKRRLGMAVSPSGSEDEQADDSDSSIEAVEENRVDDDRGVKSKAKGKSKSPLKKQPKAFKPLNAPRRGSSASDIDVARKAQDKRPLGMFKRSSPEKLQPPSRQASETSRHSRTMSHSSSDEPLSLKRPLQQASTSHTRPDSSSSDGPLAQKRPKPSVIPQTPFMDRKDSAPKKSMPNFEPQTVPRAIPSRRGASIASRGKVATRGGANVTHKNVFQSREPPKKRGTLLQNAMAAKAPKNFSNIRLRRKAELQARDIAEAAPDISALPGGLFDPSRPLDFVPIRPETLRKSSSGMVPLAETEYGPQTADSDALFLSRENTPVGDDPWAVNSPRAPLFERKPDIPRSTCFYWDRHQNDSNQPPCQRGTACKFQHSYAVGMPIAPRPNIPSADDSWGKHNSLPAPSMEHIFHGGERATCYYWDRAQRDSNQPACSRGASCKYQHHYEEGMPVAVRPPSHKFSDETREARDTTASDRPPWRKDPTQENTSQDSSSLPPWRQGSGDMSQTRSAQVVTPGAPSSVEITPDLQDILQRLRATAERTMASPKKPSAQSTTQTVAPSTPQIKARPAWNPRDALNSICYFWASQGTCSWGDRCKYLHSNDPDLPVAPSPNEQINIRKAMSDTDHRGRETCRFWLKGRCKDNNETCRWWHGPESAKIQARSAAKDQAREQVASSPAQAPPTGPRVKSVSFVIDEGVPLVEEPESISSANQEYDKDGPQASASIAGTKHPNISCPFWTRGDCHHGSKCWYRHEHPIDQGSNLYTQDVEMIDRIEEDRSAPVRHQAPPTFDPMTNARAFAISESLSSKIDEATIAPQAKTKRSTEAPSPTPISDPPIVVSKVKRPKMSMDDYRRKKALKELGNRAKEVTFGLDETQSLLLDFGDMTKTLEAPWGVLFSGLDNVRFDQMCMAQDFQAQQGFLQRLGLWHGNLVPADVGDADTVRSIDKAADELVVRSAGLLSTFSDFIILTFPAKKEEWRFLESTFEQPQDARLRYFIFRSNIDIRRSLETKPTSLAIGSPYRNVLVDKFHRLHFQTLVPVGKKPQKTPIFYLLFPATSNSTADFLVSWLQSSDRNCKIYSSQSEGSWHFFTHAPEIDTGSILVHESAASELDRLPNLYSMATTKNFAFWYISESSCPYPMFPSTSGLEDSNMGQLTAIRLFPHGCAFLLTPSFIISEPQLACDVLKWFLAAPQPKYLHSTPRTWKLVCCHNFADYVLELANSKADEKESFELKHRDNPAKDAMMEDKGLSFPQCRVRYKLHRMLVEFDLKRNSESASDGFESNCDDSDYPFIHADKNIDPDDEKALVEWFAAWSMRNLDMYKKFVVVGSSESQLRGRFRRMKEFTIRKEAVAESPKLAIPNFKKVALSNKSTTSPLESPRSPMSLQKQKAVAVAAKISALSPSKTSSNSKDLERNTFDDVVMESAPAPQQETRRNSSLSKVSHPRTDHADGNPTSHGLNPQLHPNILSFSAITGANAKDAEQFLSKTNNDVRAAVDLYNNDSLEDQIMDLIAAERTKQIPRLATADADAARAKELYDSPSMTTQATQPGSSHSRPDARSPAQFNSADDYDMQSPMGLDGTDDRPASSGTESSKSSTRSGIQSDEKGLRFVPRSVRPNSSIRKEIHVRPGYTPPEDGEFYQIPSRRGSASGTENQSAIASPVVGDGMDIDSEGGESRTGSRWAKTEKVLKEIRFEPTSAWYRKLREQGGGWEHMLVAGWEVALHKTGIGMKS